MVFAMRDWPARQEGYYSIQELEEFRLLAAYLVSKFGPRCIVLLDRVEKELAEARAADPMLRAQAILAEAMRERQSLDGGVKAIPLTHS